MLILQGLPALVVCLTSRWACGQEEWPQFRGPGGQGHADHAELPLTWSEQEHVTWKRRIPGEGHSSPVISGDQIWLTTAITNPLSEEELKARLAKIRNPQDLQIAGSLKLQAICVSRSSGEILMTVDLLEVPEPEPKHALNSYASPTPVIARGVVFCHFGTYGTVAIDCVSGAVLWKNSTLHIEHQNGPGSSPIVLDDKVIVHLDGTDSQSIVALRASNGEELWRTKRSGEMDPTPELQKAYGTPLIVDQDGQPVVLSPAANWVYGYDPADGREIWKAAYGKLGFSTVPRPVTSGDTAFIATSYMQSRLLAVRLGGQGDVTASHVVWTSDRQIPQKPSLIVEGERLYFVSDQGIVRCLKTGTGEEVWFKRLPGDYSASPIASQGRLYFFSQEGHCTVLKASDDYQILAENKLDTGIMASPAVADDALFIRTTTDLYRIDR